MYHQIENKMVYINSKVSLLAIGIFLIGISSCSSSPKIKEFPSTAIASNELKILNDGVTDALNNQVDVLSPGNFKEAQESSEKAKKDIDNHKESKKVLHQIAKGTDYLRRANEVAGMSRSSLQEVVVARQQAISAEAPSFFSKEFADVDHQMQKVTQTFENNEMKTIINETSDLKNAYLNLELKAIKHTNLGQSLRTIEQAKKDGSKEYATKSLEAAEKAYQETEAFITENRHETDQIRARAIKLNQTTDRLLRITHSAKDTKRVPLEDLALQMENNSQLVTATKDQLAAEQSASRSLKGENKTLNTENMSLESQKEFNEKYELARKEFTPKEAEVYKQGNLLVIRLRGLAFSSSKAVIKTEDYALLSKVQRVILSFGKSTLIVEGHTDSIGSKIINTQLSEGRAQAVKEYLVANGAAENERIKAIGYGYQKPLNTNKTALGRAQNRRVDILIRPDQS